MLDVLSEGRLDFGVGRGSADYEYGNFNIDFGSRDGRFQEVLDIILNQSQGGNYILQRWQRRGSSYHQCVGSGL